MREIDESNAVAYLRETGRLSPSEPAVARRLAGGVSNEVLYIDRPGGDGPAFVLKQARPQLRVAEPWFSPVERIWREVEVLRLCRQALDETAPLFPAQATGGDGATGSQAEVPAILFEDKENFCYAMTAAPPDHRTWKVDLLAGDFSESRAAATGELLGRLHAWGMRNPDRLAPIADRVFFEPLRIDPYFTFTKSVRPELAKPLDRLVEWARGPAETIVHADYSPKNLLVYGGGTMLVDFETGHAGDPAFDLGFFLAHLVLKCQHHRADPEPMWRLIDQWWEAYQQAYARLNVEPSKEWKSRARGYLGGCLLARVDGKSKIDYLPEPSARDAVRRTAAALLTDFLPLEWTMVREALEGRAARPTGPSLT